jgi:hypothetical protein
MDRLDLLVPIDGRALSRSTEDALDGRAPSGALRRTATTSDADQFGAGICKVDAFSLKEARRFTFSQAQQTEQQMRALDPFVVQVVCLLDRPVDHPKRTLAEGPIHESIVPGELLF